MINKENLNVVNGYMETVDFEKVMNNYTSSFSECFTEGYLKLLQSLLKTHPLNTDDVCEVMSVVKPLKPEVPKPQQTPVNSGFDKLTNITLRSNLEECDSVVYDEKIHTTIKEMGFKSIYELDKRSNKVWLDYFSKNKVYLDKNVKSSKISQKILFDKSILNYLNKGKTEPTEGSVSSPN